MLDPRLMGSAWAGHEHFAEWLVKELDPKITVDIGTHKGFSAYALAKENKGDVYTIDTMDFGAKDVIDELLGKDRVKFIYGFSQAVGMDWTGGSVDILHIDGGHEEDQIRLDLEMWSKHLSTNGVILMHDILNPMFYAVCRAFLSMRLTNAEGQNIETYKRVFFRSQGLGVVTINRPIIEKIDSVFGLNNATTADVLLLIHNFVIQAMEFNK